MTKNHLGEERVFTHICVYFQFITERTPGRILGRELCRGHGGGLAGLLTMSFLLRLLSYRTREHQPRDGLSPPISVIKRIPPRPAPHSPVSFLR